MGDPVTTLLRLCARVQPDADQTATLTRAAATVRDWSTVVQLAELHGLAPLTWRHLCAAGIAVPTEASRAFRGLVVHHRHAARVRNQVLPEILDALEAAGIESVVLKGAGLAHMVYPAPELRPMRDLDILVGPADALRAQGILGTLGFDAPVTPGRRTLRFHHHLPPATCSREGFQVSVEIHRDAFSGDRPETLRLARLTAPARELHVGGERLRVLGHVDMLRHLTGHALEPAVEMPLIAVADILGYAVSFHEEIDWDLVARRYPTVVNLLTLLHYVAPLPSPLERFRPPEDTGPPARVGENFTPLRTLMANRATLGRLAAELLYPSEWWMRAYYGVPPGVPLGRVRWGRHARRLGRWALRRAAALAIP